MLRFTVDRVGDTILLGVSDDRGDSHDLLLDLPDARILGHALTLKAADGATDELDDLIRRVDN